MKMTSYWLDTAPRGPDGTSSEIPDQVDIAVVGGGITGLSAAIHFRRKGADAHVFETHEMGWGASGRNGGMCTSGSTISITHAVKRYGFDRAVAMHEAFDRAIDTVEGLVNEEGIDCSFHRFGKLNLASKPGHYESLVASYRILHDRIGRPVVLVPKSGIATEIGSEIYHGALVDPSSAGMHVGRYVKGLATSAHRHGAGLHEHARVQHLKKDGNGFRVTTARGTLRARQVLVATDGYTDGAVPRFRRRIAPVGSFIIATEPLAPELAAAVMPTGRMASDSKNLVHYFRLTPDQRMLFGGRARFALSDPGSDRRSARILHDDMIRVFPQLADTRLDYAWGGLVGMTLDRVPHAGRMDGAYYSMGYNGHGVQMSTYMGRQMVEVMDGHPEANPWRGLRFRAIPGHFGPPWFLPFADAYYRLKDRIR